MPERTSTVDNDVWHLERKRLSSTQIKGRMQRDIPLSREDEAFLARLVERANEWQRGTKSSEDTEPADTMSG